MAIREKDIRAAMATGLSCVCATCERYWEGQDKKLEKCTAVDGCGSPIVGDDFHEYKGPMTVFDKFCFMCSIEADYGVKPVGKDRLIGVCKTHLKSVDDLVPLTHQYEKVVLVHTGKSIVLSTDMPREKSLGEVIAETERQWAEYLDS